MRHRSFIALGANLGDRLGALRAAVAAIAPSVALDGASSVWDTAPELVTDQPRFLNAVVAGWTEVDPFELLAAFKRIERELGRKPGMRYGPRVIDIDLLLYGAWRVVSAELVVPHPRLRERVFVLAPLAELAPDVRPVADGATARELLARLPHTDSYPVPVARL
jgi:2-amino-4-hydroxy-6-hydroxymethyldihydropteridine diphosphokinase